MSCSTKRKLVISDVHGMYDMMIDLLKRVKYNSDQDRLIFLGDMVDKGPKSERVMEFVSNEVKKNKGILILGNHDDSLLSFLKGEWDEAESWYFNSGKITIKSYVGEAYMKNHTPEDVRQYLLKHYKHHFEVLKQAKLYYEDCSRIYVHAGFNPFRIEWQQSSKSEFLLIRDMFFRNPNSTDKTVIFGHTPTINIHGSDDIWLDNKKKKIDKIGIDGRASKGGQLNCLVIENEKNYKQQSIKYSELFNREIAV